VHSRPREGKLVAVDTAQDRPIQQVQGSLFERICDDATLFDAWRRVEGKGAQGGIDQVTIAEFRQRLHDNLMQLSADLRSGRYVPEPFQTIHIPKFNIPGETRPLQMPTVRDKIAQEAVRSVIAPLLEKTFVDCSYAYRFGKGPQKAIRRVEHYLSANKPWVAVADIDRFLTPWTRNSPWRRSRGTSRRRTFCACCLSG
jgi:retron-type reverse transcriptase